MRVSVVITNHDYGRFVGEAIDSALTQDHDDVEVIVVDDGSTDDSRAVIARYGDAVTALLQPNRGQGAAVNAGFAASTGGAVLFLDADDVLEPSAASAAARLLGEGDDVVKAHWPLREVREDGRPTGRVHPHGELADGDLRELLATCPRHVTPPQSGNAWRRAFLEQVLPMPEAPYRAGADTWLFVLACGFGRVRRDGVAHGRYRRHTRQDGVSRAFDDQVAAWLGWHEPAWAALAAHCLRAGVPVDVDAWRRASWPGRLQSVGQTLDRVVGQRPFVLVDDGHWAMEPDGRRRPLPYTPPADDDEAIGELERLRGEGAPYLVLADEASWWLDTYPRWSEHLTSRYPEVIRTDELTVFLLEDA